MFNLASSSIVDCRKLYNSKSYSEGHTIRLGGAIFEKKYVHPNNDRAIYYRFDDSGTIQYHTKTS